jgi:hypothetical protein
MQRVEHNHARRDRHFVFRQCAAVTIAAKNFEDCVSHLVSFSSEGGVARRFNVNLWEQ